MLTNKFSDLKNSNISEETKIYVHSWKEYLQSIPAMFHAEIL